MNAHTCTVLILAFGGKLAFAQPEHGSHAMPEPSAAAGTQDAFVSEKRYLPSDSQPTIDPAEAEYHSYETPMMKPGPFGLLVFDQLEYRKIDGDDLFVWEAEGWYGGDVDRLWFKTRGEALADSFDSGSGELHAYYGRLIAPFWDFQIGARFDDGWGEDDEDSQLLGAIGIEGRVPYNYEVAATLFFDEHGDSQARFTAAKELRVAQRIVAETEFETEFAAFDSVERRIGSGFTSVELGLRVRYEIKREFAPYVGISWESKLGKTADRLRADGQAIEELSAVAGIRIWF